MLTVAAILSAARHPDPDTAHEQVRVLCADLTDAELAAEIERLGALAEEAPSPFAMVGGMPVLTSFLLDVAGAHVAPLAPAPEIHTARDARQARAALETERYQRRLRRLDAAP